MSKGEKWGCSTFWTSEFSFTRLNINLLLLLLFNLWKGKCWVALYDGMHYFYLRLTYLLKLFIATIFNEVHFRGSHVALYAH